MIVTIDGPVASGKSSMARGLAERLGFTYLDTGAIYRALTLAAIRGGVALDDASLVSRMLSETEVRLDGDRVYLDGIDVSDAIRTPEVSRSVKPIAENTEARDWVNRLARKYARGRNVIAEGRDMGTVVFPDAEVKIYLSASVAERARRRYEELVQRGTPQDLQTVRRELEIRDHADMTRFVAPLRKAPDAVEFDSTGLELEETLDRLEEIVREGQRGL